MIWKQYKCYTSEFKKNVLQFNYEMPISKHSKNVTLIDLPGLKPHTLNTAVNIELTIVNFELFLY